MWIVIGLLVRSLWLQWHLWPTSQLQIVVCEVGQGDAILLSLGYTQVLVDTGPDEKIVSCLDKYMPIWDKKIDVLVLTHFDADHIGGFTHIARQFQIGYVLISLYQTQNSDLFLKTMDLLLAMQLVGTQIKQPFLGQQIDLLDFSQEYQAKYNSPPRLTLTFLTPVALQSSQSAFLEENMLFLGQKTETKLSAATQKKVASTDSSNDGSIVIFIQFGKLSMLLTGDLEVAGELALLGRGLTTRVNMLKVGHHGSKTATSLSFLQAIRPEVSLISAGKDNAFGHPHQEVLERLSKMKSQIWRTDKQADLVIRSDGQTFYLRQKNQ